MYSISVFRMCAFKQGFTTHSSVSMSSKCEQFERFVFFCPTLFLCIPVETPAAGFQESLTSSKGSISPNDDGKKAKTYPEELAERSLFLFLFTQRTTTAALRWRIQLLVRRQIFQLYIKGERLWPWEVPGSWTAILSRNR